MDIETSKKEKNFLHLMFRTKQENNASVEGNILIETVSQHQMISTTRYIKVLPQRNYEISKGITKQIYAVLHVGVRSSIVLQLPHHSHLAKVNPEYIATFSFIECFKKTP